MFCSYRKHNADRGDSNRSDRSAQPSRGWTSPLHPARMSTHRFKSLGRYGVIRFPRQSLSPSDLKSFSAHLGELEINVVGTFQEPGHPEVMILSNMVENGRPIGLADAGQSWHTDMSYSKVVAFANVLYAVAVPQRGAASRWAPPSSATCAQLTTACPPI